MARRTVNAREVTKDIKNGMTYEQVKATYKLSDKDMQKVTAELLSHNMINDNDIGRMMNAKKTENENKTHYADEVTTVSNRIKALLRQCLTKLHIVYSQDDTPQPASHGTRLKDALRNRKIQTILVCSATLLGLLVTVLMVSGLVTRSRDGVNEFTTKGGLLQADKSANQPELEAKNQPTPQETEQNSEENKGGSNNKKVEGKAERYALAARDTVNQMEITVNEVRKVIEGNLNSYAEHWNGVLNRLPEDPALSIRIAKEQGIMKKLNELMKLRAESSRKIIYLSKDISKMNLHTLALIEPNLNNAFYLKAVECYGNMSQIVDLSMEPPDANYAPNSHREYQHRYEELNNKCKRCLEEAKLLVPETLVGGAR
jgi:hypothetical protein